MSLLRTVASRSLRIATIRKAAPVAAILPHWTRSFSTSPLASKKDVIKSAPGWNPDNATESEAEVKADREPHPKNVEELQKETVETILEKSSDGEFVLTTTEELTLRLEKFGEKLPNLKDKTVEELSVMLENFEEKFRLKDVKDDKHGRGEKGETSEEMLKKVEKLEEKLSDKLDRDVNGKGEKVIEKLAQRAQEAGATLGNKAGTVKGRVEHAKDRVEEAEGSVIDEIKAGAQKVTDFMKESLDSVKTVGLGGKKHHGHGTAEKIKKKNKNVDDKVDSDRGA